MKPCDVTTLVLKASFTLGKSNSSDPKFVDVTSLRERETYSEMICHSSGGGHGGGHGRIRCGEGGAREKAGRRSFYKGGKWQK